jgi:uncharacterized membrane protein
MKATRLFTVLVLLLMILIPLSVPGIAMAQDEGASGNVTTTAPPPPVTATPPATTTTTEPPPSVTMTTDYPTVEAIATGTFTFNVVISYSGAEDRVFDLNTSGPSGWDISVTPQYDTQRISSISITGSPYAPTTKNVKLTVTPQAYPLPDPGDYTIKLEAASGSLSGSIDLTARITAKYLLTAAPYNQLYNTTASAGRDNTYSIVVTDTGTAPIDNITFSSDKPDGWEITFKPDKIDRIDTLDQQTVDVNIKPPPKTVAGDYQITLNVKGTQATANAMNVRVTVATPTVWGWVGIIIIVVVVIGLIAIFMRFGRR